MIWNSRNNFACGIMESAFRGFFLVLIVTVKIGIFHLKIQFDTRCHSHLRTSMLYYNHNETMKSNETQIKCPHCGNRFSPEVALAHDIRLELEKEFQKQLDENAKTLQKQIEKQEHEKYQQALKTLQADRESKASRLLELEGKVVSLEERERKVHEREETAELEMRKRLLEREKVLREDAERKANERAALLLKEKHQALEREKETWDLQFKASLNERADKIREEERMKAAELQKKLDDQTHLIHEMKRKAEQGSMQAQGEVQELAIEEYLTHTFMRDDVQEISKGKRGADCVHVVKDAYGNTCGKILYESKRTKHFGGDWTAKLKEDMRLTQADLGVIVTEALPPEMTRFGMLDGIWVCTFAEFKALSLLFRESLCKIGEVRATQENKGDKMTMLYHYLTGTEFRQKLEAIVEAFSQMQDDLNREKNQMMTNWSRREKQIFKVIENTVSLYGDVRGIAGTAVREISALEMDDMKFLVEK